MKDLDHRSKNSLLVSGESELSSLFRVALHYRKQLALVALLSGLIGLGIALSLPSRFAYTGLLQVIELGRYGPLPITSLNGRPLSKELLETESGFDSEIRAYLSFKYVDKYRSLGDPQAFLSQVDSEKTPQFLRLVVQGASLLEAETFLNEIIRDLKTKYDPIIESTRASLQEQSMLLERQLLDSKKLYSAQKAKGACESRQCDDIKNQILGLETSLIALRTGLRPERMRPIALADARPLKPGPVFPKTFIIILGAMIVGFLIGLHVLALRELLQKWIR